MKPLLRKGKPAILAMASVLATASCTTARTPEPVIRTVEIRTAVPTPCTPSLRPEPVYPDSDAALAAEPDVLAGVRDLRIGREMRIARLAELTAAIAACAQPH